MLDIQFKTRLPVTNQMMNDNTSLILHPSQKTLWEKRAQRGKNTKLFITLPFTKTFHHPTLPNCHLHFTLIYPIRWHYTLYLIPSNRHSSHQTGYLSPFPSHNPTTLNPWPQCHTWAHDLHKRDDLLAVFPSCQEALQQQDLEVGEHVWVLAAHHLHQLLRQLEGWRLEAQVAWRWGQHEAKVDVDDVAFVVEEDIPIMSVERALNM